MESDISAHGHHLMVEEYILAYQSVRDSLHNFTDDEKPAEVESGEIAAVQADLDAMSKIVDPEHDPRLVVLADKLAADVTDLVGLDIALQTLTPISWHKPKANKQWDRDLENIHYELLYHFADQQADPWYLESALALRRAIDDYENYRGGDKTISTERIENDIYEAKFDLHCIGSHFCDLHKQNEGN